MPALAVEKVVAGYGQTIVLREVSLDVREGEIVTLIGPNGAGKTTLLNAISGLVAVRSGRVALGERVLHRLSAQAVVRAGVCQVPEGRRIFAELTVHENLTLGAYADRNGRRVRARLAEAYEMFPILKSRAAQLGGTLSGGEQQMLAIARALMGSPRLLMLDEPSMGLAPLLVKQIYETFGAIVEKGTSILLVEQNARLALRVAHRGYVLEHGSMVLSGQAADLAAVDRLQAVYLGGHVEQRAG